MKPDVSQTTVVMLYVCKNSLKENTFGSHHMQFGPQNKLKSFLLLLLFPSTIAEKQCVIS